MSTSQTASGSTLFTTVGCLNCHSLDGSKRYGPTLKYDLGSEVLVLRGDSINKVIVNREYLIRSISNPNFEKQIGFENSKMTKTTLSSKEIDLIVDYLISINSK